MTLSDAIKLANSVLPSSAERGKARLRELFDLGDLSSGWELVSFHGDGGSSLLTQEEAVRLLTSDVEQNLNPTSALDIYYYHGDRVGLEEVRRVLRLVQGGSGEAAEILVSLGD
jgi:hypothetical protein